MSGRFSQLSTTTTSKTPSARPALRAACQELYRAHPVPDREWVAQLRLLRRHPSLLARQAGDQIALERDLTAVLLDRGLGQELARLTAATFLATLRTGNVLWLEGPDDQPLPDLVDRLLSRVRLR